MMSSEYVHLGEVADVFVGTPLTLRGYDSPLFQEDIVHVLGVSNVTDDGGIGADLPAICLAPRVREKYVVHPGDLVISARSTSLKLAMIPERLGEAILNATLLGIRCGERLHPVFLKAFLEHPAGRSLLEAASVSGSAQMSITVRQLEALSLPLPPISEQRRLVEFLKEAEIAHTASREAADKRLILAREIAINSIHEKRKEKRR